MRNMLTILQIIPAIKGWFANYKNDDGTIHKSQLTCWALVEDSVSPFDPAGPIRYCVGIDCAGEGATSEICNEVSNFSHYSFED